MPTTNWLTGTTATTSNPIPYDDNQWTNYYQTVAEDGSYGYITLSTYDTNDYSYALRVVGFNAGIPSDATITGFEVRVKGYYASGTGTNRLAYARMIYNDSRQGSSKTPNTSFTTSNDWLTTVGSSTDLWGWTAPTVSEVNDSTFGVEISCQATGDNSDIYVDAIQVRVSYTVSSTITSIQSSSPSISGNTSTISSADPNSTIICVPSDVDVSGNVATESTSSTVVVDSKWSSVSAPSMQGFKTSTVTASVNSTIDAKKNSQIYFHAMSREEVTVTTLSFPTVLAFIGTISPDYTETSTTSSTSIVNVSSMKGSISTSADKTSILSGVSNATITSETSSVSPTGLTSDISVPSELEYDYDDYDISSHKYEYRVKATCGIDSEWAYPTPSFIQLATITAEAGDIDVSGNTANISTGVSSTISADGGSSSTSGNVASLSTSSSTTISTVVHGIEYFNAYKTLKTSLLSQTSNSTINGTAGSSVQIGSDKTSTVSTGVSSTIDAKKSTNTAAHVLTIHAGTVSTSSSTTIDSKKGWNATTALYWKASTLSYIKNVTLNSIAGSSIQVGNDKTAILSTGVFSIISADLNSQIFLHAMSEETATITTTIGLVNILADLNSQVFMHLMTERDATVSTSSSATINSDKRTTSAILYANLRESIVSTSRSSTITSQKSFLITMFYRVSTLSSVSNGTITALKSYNAGAHVLTTKTATIRTGQVIEAIKSSTTSVNVAAVNSATVSTTGVHSSSISCDTSNQLSLTGNQVVFHGVKTFWIQRPENGGSWTQRTEVTASWTERAEQSVSWTKND